MDFSGRRVRGCCAASPEMLSTGKRAEFPTVSIRLRPISHLDGTPRAPGIHHGCQGPATSRFPGPSLMSSGTTSSCSASSTSRTTSTNRLLSCRPVTRGLWPVDCHITAWIYCNRLSDGKRQAGCYIRLGSGLGADTIAYSGSENAQENSYNELLTIEADKHMLFFRATMGMFNRVGDARSPTRELLSIFGPCSSVRFNTDRNCS